MFKDDQLQDHQHKAKYYITTTDSPHYWGNASEPIGYRDLEGNAFTYNTSGSRIGTTTHGKQKGVTYLIKVL